MQELLLANVRLNKLKCYEDKRTKIWVYAHCQSLGGVQHMGILIPQHVRGKEIFSFEYNETWLTFSGQALFLDPNLSMYKGKKYLPEAKMQQFSSKQHTFLTKRFDRI